MLLVVLCGSMITHHFNRFDQEQLITAIGHHFTNQIAESSAHTETLHKLSAEQKKQHVREQVIFLRQNERELAHLPEQNTAWTSGVHDLLGATRNDRFSADEAVYLFIDG